MSIVTLTLYFKPRSGPFCSDEQKWAVEINGLNQPQKEDFKARYAPSAEISDDGEMLTISWDKANWGRRYVSDSDEETEEPMKLMKPVTKYLNTLVQMKYKVVASHSSVNSKNNTGISVWTLHTDN